MVWLDRRDVAGCCYKYRWRVWWDVRVGVAWFLANWCGSVVSCYNMCGKYCGLVWSLWLAVLQDVVFSGVQWYIVVYCKHEDVCRELMRKENYRTHATNILTFKWILLHQIRLLSHSPGGSTTGNWHFLDVVFKTNLHLINCGWHFKHRVNLWLTTMP